TLSGGSSPTGTITFKAYGPNAANCTGTPAFTSTKTISGTGTYQSDDYTAGAAGDYLWTAEYSGDASNATASFACNDAEETSTVEQASPTISTTAHDANAGTQPIEDIADLEGGYHPTGTITFEAFGPNDATCSETPIY